MSAHPHKYNVELFIDYSVLTLKVHCTNSSVQRIVFKSSLVITRMKEDNQLGCAFKGRTCDKQPWTPRLLVTSYFSLLQSIQICSTLEFC